MADEIYGNVDQRQDCNLDEDHVYTDPVTITAETRDEKKNEDQSFTGGDSREVNCYRVAVVSLGLLCVLLLAIIISVAIKGTAERKQLQHEIQRQQFMYNNLTQEQDQLQATINILTQEKDQLQRVNSNLTQNIEQLQTTISLSKICEWMRFGSSLYYISSGERNWTDSKQHCMDLGAHLVIIDSEEEQEFIISQMKHRAWIGLSDMETEGVWKWVDGKVLDKPGFWWPSEPNDAKGAEDCVEILRNQDTPLNSWNDDACRKAQLYICEK